MKTSAMKVTQQKEQQQKYTAAFSAKIELCCGSELYIYIYIWSEIFGSSSEAKNGGQWSPKLRQSPYAVFHVYVLRKNRAGGLKPT